MRAATRQDNKETGALLEEEEDTGKPWRGGSLGRHGQYQLARAHSEQTYSWRYTHTSILLLLQARYVTPPHNSIGMYYYADTLHHTTPITVLY